MKQFFTIALLLITFFARSQNSVGIGTASPNASAALDISSTTKGLLIPRVSTIQRNFIVAPAKGLMVYDTSSASYWYYDKYWRNISSNSLNADSSFYSLGSISAYSMTNNTFSCYDPGGYLFDSGGPYADYGNNEDKTFSIQTSGEIVRILLYNNNLEPFYDSLTISASGHTYVYTGTRRDTLYLADANGPINIHFKSNGINVSQGFALRWDTRFDVADPVDQAPLAGWYFLPGKKAMMGGANVFDNWNKDSVASYSFSYGFNAVAANGAYAVALGRDVRAESGSMVFGNGSLARSSSIVLGDNSSSLNTYGVSLGYGNLVNGYGAFTLGTSLSATNAYSGALGYASNASGASAFAFGNSCYAIGGESMALGMASRATGNGSFTLGYVTEARGNNSLAMGSNTVATGPSSTAIGSYNDSLVNAQTSMSGTTPLLMVGNGTAYNQRSNAFLILRNGKVHIDPKSTNSGNLDSTALLFGAYNATGEGISSKRTAGGNQYGLDFYTNGQGRLSILNSGTVQVANNLTVQNGKGIIRSSDGTQQKKLVKTVAIVYNFAALETKAFPFTWAESFSSAPDAYVGAVAPGSSGGWAEVITTVVADTSTGGFVYVSNPRTTPLNANFNIKIIGIGAQ